MASKVPRRYRQSNDDFIGTFTFNELASGIGYQQLDLFASTSSTGATRRAISTGLNLRSNPEYSLAQNGSVGANVWTLGATYNFDTGLASFSRHIKGNAYLAFCMVVNAAFGTADGYIVLTLQKSSDGTNFTNLGTVTTETKTTTSSSKNNILIEVTNIDDYINAGDFIRIKFEMYVRSNNAAANATNLYVVHMPANVDVTLPGAISVTAADNPTNCIVSLPFQIEI